MNLLFVLLLALSQPSPERGTTTAATPLIEICCDSTALFGQPKRYQATLDHLRAKRKKYRRPVSFLRHLFYYVHRKHLKHYQKYSGLVDVGARGTYDCVTGTALYALLLDRLDIPYQIWEMDHHAYLTVIVDGKAVVFEATNPVSGFITKSDQVAMHCSGYQEAARAFKKAHGQYDSLIHRSITLKQLIGLQFYNRALKAFADKKPREARRYTQQALDYYPAPRIKRLLTANVYCRLLVVD